MLRNLKVLGLAIVAVLAMSAVVAQAASAAEFTAENYTASLSGEQVGEHVFTVEGNTVKCPTAVFSGSLAAASSEVTNVSAKYGNEEAKCTAFGFLSATVKMNGCTYNFKVNSGSEDNFTGTAALKCPTGAKVTIVAGTCEATVGEKTTGGATVNQEVGPINYVNMTNTPTSKNDVTVNPAATNVVADKTKDGIGCPFNGTGEVTNASYSGTTTVTGSKEGVADELNVR